MKVLHLISSGGMYGAEAVILDLSRCLRRAGHDVVLGVFANSAQPNEQLQTRAQAQGLETCSIPCRGQLDLSVPSRLRELVRTRQIDVVHAHGYKADVYAFLAFRRTSVPIVSTCHNWIDSTASLRLYGVLDRFVLRRFCAVIAVSDDVRNRLLTSGISHRRVHSIRNGVDLHAFQGISRSAARKRGMESLTVGVVARLSHEKGVDLFLRAAALVLERVPQACFVVVGDGPERHALQALIEDLKLSEHATLLGRRDDMPAIYADWDLQVLPSRQEGVPMALLEGMAAGLPVVAASVGDVPHVVRNGVTGLLVAPEDISGMAAAMAELLCNPQSRAEMSAAARSRVADEFSAERMTAAYVDIYQHSTVEKAH